MVTPEQSFRVYDSVHGAGSRKTVCGLIPCQLYRVTLFLTSMSMPNDGIIYMEFELQGEIS